MKNIVVLTCAILLGFTLFVAGTGKLPGQVEFAEAIMGSFFTPQMALVISRILPGLEIGLGLMLLLGIFPKVAAIICLPVIAGFIANNVWAISQGIGKFARCGDCFGFWERIFGALTPTGALVIDILLLVAALVVAVFYPDFFKFKLWFSQSNGQGEI